MNNDEVEWEEFVFENERYVVYVANFLEPVKNNGAQFTSGYAVENRATGVVEFMIPQLPEAISAAEQLDMAMEQAPWKWAREAHERQQLTSVNPDGSPVDEDEDPEVH